MVDSTVQRKCSKCGVLSLCHGGRASCDRCTEYAAKRYLRKRDKARSQRELCRQCVIRHRDNGTAVCNFCRNSKKESNRKRQEYCIREGLCRACAKNPLHAGNKLHCKECAWKHSKAVLTNHYKIRAEVIAGYGGACSCCGESDPLFLELDHVNNDGAAHRKEVGVRGLQIYRWAKRNNFPSRLQLLCISCNKAKGNRLPCCPHMLRRNEMLKALSSVRLTY